MVARARGVFIDSGPFVLALSFPGDARTPLTQRFLERVRATGRAWTGLPNVLETAGAISFHAGPDRVAWLVTTFSRAFGVGVWPRSATRLDVPLDELVERLGRGMKLGDALVLWAAETCKPAMSTFVTWNARHFQHKTDLAILTPQQWLRGQD
jgi:hypothetical protein